MSIGHMGLIGSVAGTPLAQAKGADSDKAKHDASTQQARTQAAERANDAAGIGRTEEDSQADDRDADGRRPWELPAKETAPDALPPDAAPPRSKDPSGQAGQQLDLCG
jgi:hypothetical protein